MSPRDEQLEDAYLQILALRALLDAEQRANAHLRAYVLRARRAPLGDAQAQAQADGDAGAPTRWPEAT